MTERKYKWSFAELIDRLTIVQQKEIYNVEHRAEFTAELNDILHDLGLEISEGNISITPDMIRDIVVLTLNNAWIWANEDNARKGTDGENNLYLTHQLNDIRSCAKKRIQQSIGGRIDHKLNNVKATNQYVPSGY